MSSKHLRPAAFSFKSSLDDFEREEIIGQGGMATVWRARHKATGTPVALKQLRADVTDASLAPRFHREAKAMAELRHDNIGRVLAFGEGGSGFGLFIAFELIDGGSLRDLKRAMGGTLPVAVVVEVMGQLFEALAYAHDAGVVHRDLKPGNIMLSDEGVVKLVDFGIAKGSDDTTLTQTGAVIGTPAYMSPEQAGGDEVDARSDLFSAGLVMSDLLLGKSPFAAESAAATLLRAMRDEVPLLSDGAGGVPWLLERVHMRLVERDRTRRFASARAVVDELRPLVNEVRLKSPHLLKDALERADEVARALRRESALREVQRAEAVALRNGGPHPASAYALYEALRIDPELADVERKLPRAALDAGVILPPRVRAPTSTPSVVPSPSAADDPALAELLAALRMQPRAAALWRKLADVRHTRTEIVDEVQALKQVLRLRRDEEANKRLAQILVGPGAQRLDFDGSDDDAAAGSGARTLLETLTTPLVAAARFRGRAAAILAVTASLGVALGALGAIMFRAPVVEETPVIVRVKEDAPAPTAAAAPVARKLKLGVRGPAVVNLWTGAGGCSRDLAAWKKVIDGNALGDANVIDVIRSRRLDVARAAAKSGLGAKNSLVIDGDGLLFFEPLQIKCFTTFVVDAQARPRLRTTPSSPDFVDDVRYAWAVVTKEKFAPIDDVTPSAGER